MPRFALFLFATRNNPELGIMTQAVNAAHLVHAGLALRCRETLLGAAYR
jgi:hypothetical protein